MTEEGRIEAEEGDWLCRHAARKSYGKLMKRNYRDVNKEGRKENFSIIYKTKTGFRVLAREELTDYSNSKGYDMNLRPM
ncbi:MAG: hypothetical protein Ta2E_08950 [Mycoplasmoidaceae bacterium]|nr:MAG: hypothetical protein Ta2E_08950 [Mycoplasmoidaceae bacterium]